MDMNEFRRLATKIDQHMQQLAAERVSDAPAIINRMMGYGPDLHKIWVGASDGQLMALCAEFQGFYRYARLMEQASEAERNRPSRPYDDLIPLPEQFKKQGLELLTVAASLERGYQAFVGSAKLRVFQSQVDAMDTLHQKWLSDVEGFKAGLRGLGAEPKTMVYVDEVFGRFAVRIKQLAASSRGS